MKQRIWYIFMLCHYAQQHFQQHVKQWGAPRSPAQAVISSREIGSMDRKSRGRGRRGPIWEVQCKQSRFVNHPGSRSGLDTLWCSPWAPPPPSHLSFPNGRAEGQPGKHADSGLGQSRAQGEPRRHSVPCGTPRRETKECEVVQS